MAVANAKATMASKVPWFVRGDVDGLFGLFIGHLLQLTGIAAPSEHVAPRFTAAAAAAATGTAAAAAAAAAATGTAADAGASTGAAFGLPHLLPRRFAAGAA